MLCTVRSAVWVSVQVSLVGWDQTPGLGGGDRGRDAGTLAVPSHVRAAQSAGDGEARATHGDVSFSLPSDTDEQVKAIVRGDRVGECIQGAPRELPRAE